MLKFYTRLFILKVLQWLHNQNFCIVICISWLMSSSYLKYIFSPSPPIIIELVFILLVSAINSNFVRAVYLKTLKMLHHEEKENTFEYTSWHVSVQVHDGHILFVQTSQSNKLKMKSITPTQHSHKHTLGNSERKFTNSMVDCVGV